VVGRVDEKGVRMSDDRYDVVVADDASFIAGRLGGV
jgi:hypothetical protein